jgi:hypothetical protein
MNNWKYLIGALIIFALFGCASSQTTPTILPITTTYPIIADNKPSQGYPGPKLAPFSKVDITSLTPPENAPQPENGKASISGLLYSKSSSTVLKKFLLYITLAQGAEHNYVPPVLDGPIDSIGDMKVETDKDGKFEINNIPPGNYFIIVKVVPTYDVVIESLTNDTPKMISLQSNQKRALGVVIVP